LECRFLRLKRPASFTQLGIVIPISIGQIRLCSFAGFAFFSDFCDEVFDVSCEFFLARAVSEDVLAALFV
jgi:hypothetical protein